MGLVISLKVNEDFYIGDEQFVVVKVHSATHFRLRHTGTGREFEITDGCPTEIIRGVKVYGARRAPSIRVAVRAPRHLKIRIGNGSGASNR